MTTIWQALESAIARHRDGDVAGAVPVYRAILESQPDHPDALYLLGAAAWTAGQGEAAAGMWRAAAASEPGNARLARWRDTAEGRRPAPPAPPPVAAVSELSERLRRARAGDTGDAAEARVAYQMQVERMRRSPYLDQPAHVHIETFASCNARCDFCPYPDLERQGTRMPMELIDKIIDDLAAAPSPLPLQVSPQKVNEPFLDRRLFTILDRITARLPHARLTLTTNGSALTGDVLDRLEAQAGLRYLWVSFNDHREADYERVMGLPYARTRARLDALHRRKESGTLAARVIVSRVGDGSPGDAAFRDWVARRYPAFEVSVTRRGDWLGQVETAVPGVPDMGCMRWFEISIAATGVVSHCCMDGQARHPIGDVRTASVLDIYNAPGFRRLREASLSRRDAAPCNACTFL